MRRLFFLPLAFVVINAFAQIKTPKPTQAQLAWHDMEFYLFMHFGPNTFTDKEWGHGDEKEEVFNPANMDCRQWCRIAKSAGATGIIATAKHHDGFCLWPSKFSKHTVRESKWRNGKGDVLKELSQACKEYGLKFGIYISPWDRNHPDYGTAKYNDVFVNMMKELFTNYGPITELWWDGANGEGPNGKKQVYDWDRFKKTVKALSPNTVIFSDIGPHIRWVGNENGIAGETNWNMLDTAGFTPGAGAPATTVLNKGNENGAAWIPAECDVSIRPGWFYHKEEDEKVKTPEQLFQLYLKSVGRGACLLLNVPPDRNGKITAYDSLALVQFKKLRDESFGNNLLKNAKVTIVSGDSLKKKEKQFYLLSKKNLDNEYLHIELPQERKINCIVVKEFIKDGQSIAQFYVQVRNEKQLESYKQTTIGHKRIITFNAIDAKDIFLHVQQAKSDAKITSIEAYYIDESLTEKK